MEPQIIFFGRVQLIWLVEVRSVQEARVPNKPITYNPNIDADLIDLALIKIIMHFLIYKQGIAIFQEVYTLHHT